MLTKEDYEKLLKDTEAQEKQHEINSLLSKAIRKEIEKEMKNAKQLQKGEKI